MKSDYRIRAEKFITKFYPVIKSCRNLNQIERCIDNYNREHHTRIQFAHGASRYAIIYSDYVIKFDYGTNKEWAGGCEDEYNRYNDYIKDSGFEYLFAEITKIHVGRKNAYIMPRVRGVGTSEKYMHNLTYEERRFIRYTTADMHRHNYGNFNRKVKIIDYAMAP